MTRQEFLDKLRKGLEGLPKDDVDERVNFYAEMILDRMEEGVSEQEAVLEIGDVDGVISRIMEDIPIKRIVKEKIKKEKNINMSAWVIVLLVLGSPIWLSLLISGAALAFSIFVSLWSVVISLWAVFASFIGCAIGGFASGVWYIALGNILTGIMLIGVGAFLAGLSVFAFFGCRGITRAYIRLTKKTMLGIKRMLVKKEVKQ